MYTCWNCPAGGASVYPPYPYPYQYPPVAAPPLPPTTPKGITWCVRALMLYPIALVLSVAAGLVLLTLLGSIQVTQNPFDLLASFLPVLALGVAASVVSLVVLIFY